MFGRGSWAIVGLAKESLEAFRMSLADRATMVASSQMAASAITRHLNADSLGINPFRAPRLDEEHSVGLEHQQEHLFQILRDVPAHGLRARQDAVLARRQGRRAETAVLIGLAAVREPGK